MYNVIKKCQQIIRTKLHVKSKFVRKVSTCEIINAMNKKGGNPQVQFTHHTGAETVSCLRSEGTAQISAKL